MIDTVNADAVVAAIRANSYTHINEDEWQAALAEAIAVAGLPVEREVRIPGAGRIDLLCQRVGVEVKVAGRAADVERQLRRYAGSALIDELVLVTSRAQHRALPAVLDGKPLRVVHITGAFG